MADTVFQPGWLISDYGEVKGGGKSQENKKQQYAFP